MLKLQILEENELILSDGRSSGVVNDLCPIRVKSVPGHAAWGRSHSQFLIPKPRSKTGFVKDTNMEKVAPGVTQGPGLGHEMDPRTNTLGKTKMLVHPQPCICPCCPSSLDCPFFS